jgi:GAF domain-containing protein
VTDKPLRNHAQESPLSLAPEGQGVFDTIAMAAVTLARAKLCIVWVVDVRDHALWPEGRYTAEPGLDRLTQDLGAVPDAERVIRELFESEAPRYVPDIRTDPRWAGHARLSDGVLGSLVELPLHAGDRTVGMLSVFFGDREPLALEERETLELVASHASIAIENARVLVEAERRASSARACLASARVCLSRSTWKTSRNGSWTVYACWWARFAPR